MEIDLNINNRQKHWLLVLLDKVKNLFIVLYNYLCIGCSWIIKKKKIIIKSFISILIIGIVTVGIVFYFVECRPKMKLEAAIDDVTQRLSSENDSIKASCALELLTQNYNWNYEGIDNYILCQRLIKYRQNALEVLEQIAYSGNPSIQYMLGKVYQKGYVPEMHERNLTNYNRYCNKENMSTEKYFNMGTDADFRGYYFVVKDNVKAAYWFGEAAKNNFAYAYNDLGLAYKYGNGVEVDLLKAVENLRKGAELGEEYAEANFGDLFMDGVRAVKIKGRNALRYTTETEYDIFLDNYHYSVSNSYRVRTVTHIYFKTNGGFESVSDTDVDLDYDNVILPKDIEKAKIWWNKAAAKGNQHAKERLQKIYN